MSEAVGSALAKPALKLKKAGGFVKGFGNSLMGLGKELAREASSDVKERGVTGFYEVLDVLSKAQKDGLF